MSAKHSKEATSRIRSGDHLLSAFDVDGARVAACFLDETRPYIEEEDEEPRPGGVLVAAGRKVRSSLDHLIETDFAVVRAEGLESVLRRQFKEDKRELAFCIVAFRRLVMGQYVEPDLANLGLEPVNVRDGYTILRRGELVDERFGAPNLAKMLGKSRFDKPIDLGPYVAEIREKSAALLALSHEINEAHRASDRARIARSRAKDVFDRVYLRAARIFEDMCRFCGLDDLAARVRGREGRAKTSSDESVSEAEEETAPQEVPDPMNEAPASDLQTGHVLRAQTEVPEPAHGRSGSLLPLFPGGEDRLSRLSRRDRLAFGVGSKPRQPSWVGDLRHGPHSSTGATGPCLPCARQDRRAGGQVSGSSGNRPTGAAPGGGLDLPLGPSPRVSAVVGAGPRACPWAR